MNKISEIRQKVQKNGSVTIGVDDFNQLQAEWIKRTGLDTKSMLLKFDDNGSGQLFSAKAPFVDYEVFEGHGGWCAEYKLGVACIPLNRQKGVSKEIAIKICQDDFESRIRQCIQ